VELQLLKINNAKAALIYAEIDRNPLKTAVVEDRSNHECYFPFKWKLMHAAAI
jgi:hypothetical protein